MMREIFPDGIWMGIASIGITSTDFTACLLQVPNHMKELLNRFCLLPISQPKSTLIGLIKEMIAKFEEELPLYSLSSSDADRQSELLSYIARITEGAVHVVVVFEHNVCFIYY